MGPGLNEGACPVCIGGGPNDAAGGTCQAFFKEAEGVGITNAEQLAQASEQLR